VPQVAPCEQAEEPGDTRSLTTDRAAPSLRTGSIVAPVSQTSAGGRICMPCRSAAAAMLSMSGSD
jgi:hypothetical protein